MAVQAWVTKDKEALKAYIKKSSKSLQALKERDAVEADTRTFVTDLLVEGLGFDKYEDLTAEYQVKGEFADIGIRVDKKLLAFVEIKRITQDLKEQHLRQAKTYAANEGVSWIVLTNGRIWQVYHISNSTPIEHALLFETDLLAESTPAAKVEKLWMLSKNALKRGTLSEIWKAESALQDSVLGKALLSTYVQKHLRAEVRRITGELVDTERLKQAVAALLGK
jgi:predicted type IV restriction endonuclease